MQIETSSALTLSQAARTLPTKPSPSTLWRWCRRGCKGVRLDYARVGRRIVTTPEALDCFARALAELDACEQSEPRDLSLPIDADAELEAVAEREGL